MTPEEQERLLEAATSAARERDPQGRLQPSPAWADLSEAEREQLFHRQMRARVVERALDEEGLSSTARAVMHRIGFIEQL